MSKRFAIDLVSEGRQVNADLKMANETRVLIHAIVEA